MSNSQFYRDQYRRMVKWLVVNAMVTAGLVAVLAYMIFFPGQTKYYATTTSGQVVPLHSLSEPVLTNSYIVQWSSIATRKVFNFDFVHYRSQIQSVHSYFTPSGWAKFQQALKQSKLLQTVINQKVMMTAVVSNSPVVLARQIVHGRYTWRVQMPVLVTFQSASEHQQLKLIVTMNVQRVPALQAAKGILISDFAAAEPV